MASQEPFPKRWVLGSMSGTSLDGVSVALLKTDGVGQIDLPSMHLTLTYSNREQRWFRSIIRDTWEAIRQIVKTQIKESEKTVTTAWIRSMLPAALLTQVDSLEHRLTELHIEAALELLKKVSIAREEISVFGLHGQTIAHLPQFGWSWQLSDPEMIAARLQLPVISHFRDKDLAAGGQGAPLLPIYHAALVRKFDSSYPSAFLNIGGVGNLTMITGPEPQDMVAFDTGPGNGLIDAWVARLDENLSFDPDGRYALAGRVEDDIVEAFMMHPYFKAPAPKSLDRYGFESLYESLFLSPRTLSLEDGAATLATITAQGIIHGCESLHERPKSLYVTGGGRHNRFLMQLLRSWGEENGVRVENVDQLEGTSGDALEAEGFAYFSARSLQGLPITYPNTTGVSRAMTAGTLCYPR